MNITENQLDEWVRLNAQDAQGVIPELVYRLVQVSSLNPTQRRFPLGDSIGQPGPDGELETDSAYDPFVPSGKSFWEIGTGIKVQDKATKDYRELTDSVPEEIRKDSTFIFVTPLSGRRGWKYDWNEHSLAKWVLKQKKKNQWRDVRVIDGTRLIDWLRQFPNVSLWLGDKMGLPSKDVETVESRWGDLKSIGEPPPLPPAIFTEGRKDACAMLNGIFQGDSIRLKIDTRYPAQMPDFIAAYVSTLDASAHTDNIRRCLIVKSVDAWSSLISLKDRHILIAAFDLDDTDGSGIRLLEQAKRKHAVIYCGAPGGIPDLNRVSLPSAKSSDIQNALEKGGYSEERARSLALKAGNDLTSLLRCIQGLSAHPAWAQATSASELAISELLGSWNESSTADKNIVEALSGKEYGEWIRIIREISVSQDTPLSFANGIWKFIPRYEGWHVLGVHLFDEHLDRLKECAILVLSELDPKFSLPAEDRSAANFYGKSFIHSSNLRNGIANTIALLGSHPSVTSASAGKPERVAALVVRSLLSSSDWTRWASLNSILPLLAEASPIEFLDAIEREIESKSSLFRDLFSQETDGFFAESYVTGLLWALETLAWSEDLLGRAVLCLSELAALDPGGKFSNRPANSLRTILLPWLPQTIATPERCRAVVESIFSEQPDVAWTLLLDLLPDSHSMSSGSARPSWRDYIPSTWSKGVKIRTYNKAVEEYSRLAFIHAVHDTNRIVSLIKRLDNIPSSVQDQVLHFLSSSEVKSLPEIERLPIWAQLKDIVIEHRKFSGADWAMKKNIVDKLEEISNSIAPVSTEHRHKRLFSGRDWDLHETNGDYDQQQSLLDQKRGLVIQEIASAGGVEAIVEFSRIVEAPSQVGIAYGLEANAKSDEFLLPLFVLDDDLKSTMFIGGYIWGRFRSGGWDWVDQLPVKNWRLEQTAQLFAYLPFSEDSWSRINNLLGEDEELYWNKANVNPYQSSGKLEYAISRLVDYGRPIAAITCFRKLQHDKAKLDSALVIRTLMAALSSSENKNMAASYDYVKLIQAIQRDESINLDSLFAVEWAYVQLLNDRNAAKPVLLEKKLATEPSFFCEVIRLVYLSSLDQNAEPVSEERKVIATNAYHLLTEWTTPPGLDEIGQINEVKLKNWISEVRVECERTGHIEVAMTMIGGVFMYSPPDVDGLWIDRSVARVLNGKDAKKMRNGFCVEIYNSRGVHGFSNGREEMALAMKYRRSADELDAAGFLRFGASVRELGVSYERDSIRDAERDH